MIYSDLEYEIFSRQFILENFNETNILKLNKAKISIVGIGGIACPLAQYLVSSGIKNLTLFDGDTIEIPIYDFATHTRMRETETVHSVPIVIVEGLMILGVEFLRKLMDLKVYVDVPADIRFIRRLKRDIEERDRDVKSVVHQYLETVRPMHEQFVEKTKNYADIIIPDGGNNQTAINLIQEKIQLLLTA